MIYLRSDEEEAFDVVEVVFPVTVLGVRERYLALYTQARHQQCHLHTFSPLQAGRNNATRT